MYEIFILALALSIDAMVVSFALGLIVNQSRIKTALSCAFSFGFFQAFMPLIGAFLTGFVYNFLVGISKWVVFLVFVILGIKFIIESFKRSVEPDKLTCVSFACILGFSISTSIDALFAGIPLRLMNINLLYPILLIGLVTFVNSLISFALSQILVKFNAKYIQIFGGIILVLLGVKEIIK